MNIRQPDIQSDTSKPSGRRLAFLSLAAPGVVYGDIGTSPLYSIRECFHGEWDRAHIGQHPRCTLADVTDFFHLPPGQVVEIGTQS